MKLKISGLIIALVLSLSILTPARHISAVDTNSISSQIEIIRREREALVEEQRRLQAELDVVNREAQTLGTAVKSLDTTKKKLATDIRVTQSKINSTNLSIKSLETTVADKEHKIAIHKVAIGTAIQKLSNYDNRSFMLDLLASANFSDLWRDRSQVDELSVRLQDEISNLRETKTLLSKEKQLKEKAKVEQLSLASQLQGQKSVVEENQKAKEQLLAETKNKEAAYQQMLQENIAREKQFESELFRLESELKIALDPSLIPDPQSGIFSWPLDNVYITQKFGKTLGAARLYASGTHNGVDFRASQGTPVKAMLSGVVEGAGNTDEQKGCYSYGRWILIKHSNGLSTVYAHLSASLVKTGQAVNTGDVIGYSGGTPRVFGSGYSTGPHLHIGLFASQGVVIKQFVTSNNCKQVVVPIADVKAYLDPLAYLPAL